MKLPAGIRPKQLAKVLPKAGFIETHRIGSHIHFHHPDCRRTQVSIHPKPLPKGTLKAILNQTQLTVEELKRLL